jgi:hypothetical protein
MFWKKKKSFIVVDASADVDNEALKKLEDEGYIIISVVGDPNKVLVRHEL